MTPSGVIGALRPVTLAALSYSGARELWLENTPSFVLKWSSVAIGMTVWDLTLF